MNTIAGSVAQPLPRGAPRLIVYDLPPRRPPGAHAAGNRCDRSLDGRCGIGTARKFDADAHTTP